MGLKVNVTSKFCQTTVLVLAEEILTRGGVLVQVTINWLNPDRNLKAIGRKENSAVCLALVAIPVGIKGSNSFRFFGTITVSGYVLSIATARFFFFD